MSDPKPNDPKAVVQGFNQLLRAERTRNRVNWTPSTSLDPAVQRADRQALNDALRKAGGHEPQHEEADPEPQTFPWRSLDGAE